MSGRASPNARLSRGLKERLRRLEGFMRVRQFTLSCSPRPSSRDLLLVIVACLYGLVWAVSGELTSDIYCRVRYARLGRWDCSWRIGARWLSTTNATTAKVSDLSRREVPRTLARRSSSQNTP